MSEIPSPTAGTITRFFGDGPWRSKSVLAALAAVVVGLGSWISDLNKGHPSSETDPAHANPAGTTAPDATNHSGASADQQATEKKALPPYVPFSASYAAAYCIGWLFRKLMRLILLTSAVVITLLAYGKCVGWDVTRTQEQVKRGSEWAQHEAAEKRDYLLHLLPSAVGGGAGIFLGFRRRNRATPTVENRSR